MNLGVLLFFPCKSNSTILINICHFRFFQFLNTRSQKGDKNKDQGLEDDKNSDLDQDVSEAYLSLMDRTKRQAKSARENLKKNSKALSSYEEEAMDLEELLSQSRQKAEATKAARARVVALRRQLEEFEAETPDHPSDNEPEADVGNSAPAPDVASALAASLHASVSVHFIIF